MNGVVALELPTGELSKSAEVIRKAFATLMELKSIDEVDEFRKALRKASAIAKLLKETEQVRHDFIFLEIACLRKLKELGAEKRIPSNSRPILSMTEDHINALIVEWPKSFSIASLLAFARIDKGAKKTKRDFETVVDNFPDVSEWARAARWTEEPFTIESVVDEYNPSLPAPINGNALKTIKTALQTALTRAKDVTLLEIIDLPAFISYRSSSNEWFHIPIESATIQQLDMVIEIKQRELESYKGQLSKLEVLRAKAVELGYDDRDPFLSVNERLCRL